jgi:adenylate cyclase
VGHRSSVWVRASQSDPIVRIEVGRLRRDLERYYLAEGRDDPIPIIIPEGRYAPTFEAMDPASAPGSIDDIEN